MYKHGYKQIKNDCTKDNRKTVQPTAIPIQESRVNSQRVSQKLGSTEHQPRAVNQ